MAEGDTYVMHRGVWRGLNGADDVGEEPATPTITMPAFVGAGSPVAAATSVTPSYPAGTKAGMAAILVVETAAQALPSVPTGWAHVDNGDGVTFVSPQDTGTGGAAGAVGLRVYIRRVGTDGGDTVTVGDSGDHQAAFIVVYENVPTTGALINKGFGNVQATSDTSVEIPGGTTTADKCLVVLVAANATDNNNSRWNNDFSNANLANVTRRQHMGTATGVGGGIALADGELESASNYGTTSATVIASSAQARISFALLPGTTTSGGGGNSGFDTYFGASNMSSTWGNAASPDILTTETTGANVVSTGGLIDDLEADGRRCILKATPGNSQMKNVDESFSPTIWKSWFSTWKNSLNGVTGGSAKLKAAVCSGTIRMLYVLDDFVGEGGDNAFHVPTDGSQDRPVTYDQMEDICAYAKSFYPWFPTFARGALTGLKDMAGTKKYKWLDAGQCSWRPSSDWKDSKTARASADAKIKAHIDAGVACGLAPVGWENILAWGIGDASKNDGWGNISGANVGNTAKPGLSPMEIKASCEALLARDEVHAVNLWAYSITNTGHFSYYDRTNTDDNGKSIQSAMIAIRDGVAKGRLDGPINIRTGTDKNLDSAC